MFRKVVLIILIALIIFAFCYEYILDATGLGKSVFYQDDGTPLFLPWGPPPM